MAKKDKEKSIPEFRLLADSVGMKAEEMATWLDKSAVYIHKMMSGDRECPDEIRERLEDAICRIEKAARRGRIVPEFSRAIQRRMLELKLTEEDAWMEGE